ncbi:tyrosine-type recombinase/integrase [Amycolatopsis sp. WAC 04182]|uniref:tyrosine-type recombinase/integrase n=1 Tax=Amycolatopsis sp. WAC 04182 TaxID=2203198 RepID=UPI0013159C4A
MPPTTKVIEIAKRRLARRVLTGGCGIAHFDGAECDSALVFLNGRGGVLAPDTLGRRLREAARGQGVTPKTGYAARRGYATRTIEGGADVFQVQRTMDHADLEELAGYVQERQRRAPGCSQLSASTHPSQPSRMNVGHVGPTRATRTLPDAPGREETNVG